MKILVLDDDVRRHGWFAKRLLPARVWHVYDYHRACAALRATRFDLAYLDHSLNGFGRRSIDPASGKLLTGVDVAKFIAAMHEPDRPKRVIAHTWDPDGGRAIVDVLAGVVPARFEPYQAMACNKCLRGIEEHLGPTFAEMVCPPGSQPCP